MEAMKKCVKVGCSKVYDMEKLYARLLIVSQSRHIDLSELFKYELSPVPSSLFDEYGDMRKGSKAVLLNTLAVFANDPLETVDAELFDGNEAIYHKLWPKNVTVKGFAEDFVNTFARNHDTYVIFDRYNEQSIKSHERRRRAKGTVSRKYTLKSDTTLPAKDAVMTSAENKKALINFICNTTYTNSSLHLIGEDGIFGHEEADTNLISYLLKLLPEKRHLQIVAADTDIFVLLVFFWWLKKPSVQVSMKKYDGKVIDINATALKLKDKCFDLLAIHALSGCDSVSYPFGKGKVSAINLLLKSDLKLEIFSDPEANGTDWLTAPNSCQHYMGV